MGVLWAGAGWFGTENTWGGWCMLEEGLCVGLFWAAILHVLSYVLFCHDLLLHGVFAEDIGQYWTFLCLIFALTQFLTLRSVLGLTPSCWA